MKQVEPGSEDAFGTRSTRDDSLAALLARTPLFCVLSSEEQLLIQGLMFHLRFGKGELLFRQGAAPDGLYVLERGEVDVSLSAPGNRAIVLGRLGAPEVFGEMALVAPQEVRSASARAATEAHAWFLDQRVFNGLCALHHPLGFKLLRHLGLLLCQRLRSRYAELAGSSPSVTGRAVPEHLDGQPVAAGDLAMARIMPCFQRLNEAELAGLSSHLIRLEVPRGRRLFDQSDLAGACYFVLRGAVEIDIRREDGGLRLALLGPGQTVGHPGILDDAPSGSVATVREDAILAVLTRPTIAKLLDQRSALTLRLLEIFNESLVAAIHRTNMLAARTAAELASG